MEPGSVTTQQIPAGCPAPGTIFAAKYRIERVLGVGGMGVVYAAVHIHLDERVALKLLLPAVAQNVDLVRRFLREGRAAVKIRSAHVCRVFDVGIADDGTPYLSLEYLDGTDLADLLEARGPFPIDAAVDYVLQACDALADAHARGIVHRDLKPANLFLASTDHGEQIKVLDFGISKMADAVEMSETSATWMAGSPLYMSPEQLRSTKDVDARSDIWSLGVILHQLLTGKVPFEAGSLAELGALVLASQAPLLRAFRADVPPELEVVVRRCLEKDVAMRVQSVRDLVSALAPFGSGASHEAVRRVLAGPSAVTVGPCASDPQLGAAAAGASSPALAVTSPSGLGGAPAARLDAKRLWAIASVLLLLVMTGLALIAASITGSRSAGGVVSATSSGPSSSIASVASDAPASSTPANAPAGHDAGDARPHGSSATSASSRAPARPRPSASAAPKPPTDFTKDRRG